MDAASVKAETPWEHAAGAGNPSLPSPIHAIEVATNLAASMHEECLEELQLKPEGADVKAEVNNPQNIVDMIQEVIDTQVDVDDAMAVKEEADTNKLNPRSVVFTDDMRLKLEMELEVLGAGAGGSGTAHASERETQHTLGRPKTEAPAKRPLWARDAAPPPPPCGVCARVFRGAAALAHHMRAHSGDEPYGCDKCHWRFARLRDLKRHYGTHARAKWKTFYRKFLQGGATDEGARDGGGTEPQARTQEKPYPCKMCDEWFKDGKGLLEHERQHAGEKPYSCPTCSKKFAQLLHLRNHEREHTGEKPYSCETCHKSFTQRSTLTRHEQVHTHVCPTCNKGYTRPHDLKRHEATHTGEKPYSCHMCHKTFTQCSPLTWHEQVHAHVCPTCDNTTPHDLKRHETEPSSI